MQTVQPAPSLEKMSQAAGALLTDEEKWECVLARDLRFDGRFVVAVRSTGVYCRPSCPSKRARRENVEFFLGPDAAEKAGFRPCKRCKPREPSVNSELVARACDFVQSNLDKKITLNLLSEHVGLSPFHLQRVFKHALGLSPRQYAERLRLNNVTRSLRNGKTVNNALYDAGFSSRSRLYEKSPGQLGVSPGVLRRGGEGLEIRYTIIDSPLGRLLLGATEFGICAVCMGDSDSEVEQRLLEDYPAASLSRDDAAMSLWVSLFEKYFDGQNFPPGLPIDVQATAFQWRVWRRIQSTPYGQTISYTDVARALGKPKSVRAVANACANNKVALVVPCHRVIGKDGALHGYFWGLERKRTLISRERIPQTKVKNQDGLTALLPGHETRDS